MNKSIFYVLVCVFLWALIPVVSKLGQDGLDNHQFLFWSSLSSLLFFLGIGIYKKKINHLGKISKKKMAKSHIIRLFGHLSLLRSTIFRLCECTRNGSSHRPIFLAYFNCHIIAYHFKRKTYFPKNHVHSFRLFWSLYCVNERKFPAT